MKRRLLLASALTLAFSVTVLAQTAVPDTVSYQGRVTDASGNAVGAGTAVYRTAFFRIYDNASGGTRLWSEQQTITVANGEFSVLLGTGTAVVGETNANPLNAIFTAKDRYLGVTIDDGVAPAESEITPRQQLVTTAFAFRAKVAESVASTAITTAMIANGAVTTTQLGDSAVSSSKIVDLTIATADIANGAITAAKLGSDVGAWTTTSGNAYRTSGNVGVGTSAPTALLSAGSAVGNSKIAVYDDGANARMGFGYQSGQLRIHTNASTDKISFLNTEAGATELVTIKGTGNVGIGTASPTGKLDVNGVINLFDSGTKSRFGGLASEVNGTLVNFGINDTRFGGVTTADPGGLIRVDARGFNLFQFHARPANATTGTEVMSITAGGNVGIGNTAPTAARLVVSGGTSHNGLVGAYLNSSVYGPSVTHGAHIMSIYAAGGIWSGDFFIASSDARMKTIVGRSDTARDLATLQRIEVTDYTYVDTVAKGTGSQKKVIAQQVETVFPQAVSRQTDVIPDIYQKATIKDGWVALPTDLKKGERVKLVAADKEGTHEVLEVAAGKFRTDSTAEDGPVFVFGREVKDFRAVDYEAIAMLNVSATQQLAARVVELEKQNAALAAQNSAALGRLEALEKRFPAFARTADAAGNNN